MKKYKKAREQGRFQGELERVLSKAENVDHLKRIHDRLLNAKVISFAVLGPKVNPKVILKVFEELSNIE